MDSFHNYLKKQLVEYVEAERKKGIPLIEIEKVLLDAGHKKNIVDEVFLELKKEVAGKTTKHKDPIENDLVNNLKGAFSKFMAKSSNKEVEKAKKDFKNTDTKELIEEVIDDVEIIEEKTMLESFTFFIYLIIIAMIVMFSAGGTDSQITNVIIGFLPAMLSIFISFFMLSLADNVPVFVFIPLVISTIFYALGKFTQIGLFQRFDIESLAIVNFLLGFFFNVLIVYVRFVKPKHMKKKIIKKNNQIINPNNKVIPVKAQNVKSRNEISDLKKEFNL